MADILLNYVLEVEFRGPDEGLSDPPTRTMRLPMPMLLDKNYRLLESQRIRAHHLSFIKLMNQMEARFNFTYNSQTWELGYLCKSPREGMADSFIGITNQLSLQNAIGYLQSQSAEARRDGKIRLAFWTPKPTTPVFRRSARAQLPQTRDISANDEASNHRPMATTRSPTHPESSSTNADATTEREPTLSQNNPDIAAANDKHFHGGFPQLPPESGEDEPMAEDLDAGFTETNDKDKTKEGNFERTKDKVKTKDDNTETEEDDTEPEEDNAELEEDNAEPEEDNAELEEDTAELEEDKAEREEDGEDNMPELQSHTPTRATNQDSGIKIDMKTLENIAAKSIGEMPVLIEGEDDEDYNLRKAEWEQAKVEIQQRQMTSSLETLACMHLTEGIWLQVCALFHHDPNIRNAEYVVKIQGFQRKLLPVQAHAVYWCLEIMHGIEGSTFLGHIMGIGKTTIAFAFMYVQHLINCLWDEVYTSPEDHHNPADQTINLLCPKNNEMRAKFGFDCPCSRSSPTYHYPAKFGVWVIFAPLVLMPVWTGEAAQCFPSLPNPKNKNHCTGNPELDGIGDMTQMVFVRAHGNERIPECYKKHMRGKEEEQIYDDGTLAPSEFDGRTTNSKFCILTTSNSYVRRVVAGFEECKSWTVTPPKELKKTKRGVVGVQPRTKTLYTPKFSSIVVSAIIRDEFHVEKLGTSATINAIKIAKAKQPKHPISLFPMSGSPITNGPTDVAFYTREMARPEWKRHPILKKWMNNELVELGKQWDDVCRQRKPDAVARLKKEIQQRFQPLYETLMLRFNDDSNFLDAGKVVNVPLKTLVTLNCQHSEFWTTKLAKQKEEEDKELRRQANRAKEVYAIRHHGDMSKFVPPSQTKPDSNYRTRICSNVPALMDLMHDDGTPLKLTLKEWIERKSGKDADGNAVEKWIPETPSDPYYANLNNLVDSSAKLSEIGMLVDRNKNLKDKLGKKCRMVFGSYFYASSYLIYLYLKYCKNIPDQLISFVNKTQTAKQMQTEMEKFCGTPKNEYQGTSRYLIGTTSCFAMGITLTSAIGVLLMEPDYRLTTMIQYYARVCRQGNPNPETFIWQIKLKDSDIEKRIFELNKFRSAITISTDRKVGELVENEPEEAENSEEAELGESEDA